MGRLLSDNEATARRAFRDAVANRWLEDGEGTLAVAVAFDGGVDPVERTIFGRLLDARRTQGIVSLGGRGSVQLFVVRSSDTRAVVDQVRSEAALRALNADLERQVIERTQARGLTWQLSPDLLGALN